MREIGEIVEGRGGLGVVCEMQGLEVKRMERGRAVSVGEGRLGVGLREERGI